MSIPVAAGDDFLVNVGMSGPVIVEGRGAEVRDEEQRSYLDLEAGPGVVSVGHCHPRVVEAIREQAGKLTQGPGRYYTAEPIRLAKRLSALTGGRLRRSIFVNSGAEAAEVAIKLGLKYAISKGKQGLGILALEHGFHGRLSLPLALTGMGQRKRGMGPFATFPGVVHVPAPYCYRCPLGLEYPSCGIKCAEVVQDRLQTSVPGEAAILIAEPILGVGGIIVPPREYWPRVDEICKANEITLIHDEVFTGFGRTGLLFGHEHWSTRPDMITFAKAIGGGIPFGGVLATEEIGTAFEAGDHFTTFGPNNQIGSHVANTVLDIVKDESLSERASTLGEQFIGGLRDLALEHECIGDVRGLGLMIGVEIVKNRETKTPDPDRCQAIRSSMLGQGVLVGVTGVYGTVLRITPPLVIDSDQIARALGVLDAALSAGVP
jgi:4-aminobutyrate aminotransferase / (S)-3-amino-2-methylpropionate transaminase / 5-aminovalerate transaminase